MQTIRMIELNSLRFRMGAGHFVVLKRKSAWYTQKIFIIRIFFCFGEYEVDEYRKHGAHVEKFYPCGSLIDSYFRALPESKRLKESFDICIVSNPWNYYPYDSTLGGQARRSFELLLGYLAILQKHHRLKIVVPSRGESDSKEYKSEVDWI
mgnify:FL=1